MLRLNGTELMISDKHRTLFVHIPKVAGQSIETMFLNDLDLTWEQRDVLLMRKKKPTEKGPFRLAHLTAEEYVKYDYIPQELYDSYFKFSFVRNPFSRTYSFYKYLGYSKICDFDFFVTKVLKKKVEDDHFFFRPQSAYVYKDDKLYVDFIGRFEQLQKDMDAIFEKCNLKSNKLPFVNKSRQDYSRVKGLLWRNPSLLFNYKPNSKIYKDFREAYSSRSKEGVKKIYSADLDKFQYSFE